MERLGKLTIRYGRYPEAHELKTTEIFIKQGFDVEFLPESKIKHQKSADILMNGQLWELKSPIGKGKRTIEKTFEKASKQCNNLILDFRRCPIHTQEILKTVDKEWNFRRNLKHMLIITKQNKVLDYHR